MKRLLSFVLLFSSFLILPARDGRFFASAGATLLISGDSRFAGRYGKAHASPELRLGYNLYRHFYFCLGGSFISANGVLPETQDEIKATQTFFSLGAGWETKRTRRLQADIAAALLVAGFRENAMDEKVSEWHPGLDVRTGLRYFMKDNMFLGVTLGYAGAWPTVRFAGREKEIVLGGLRFGGFLGFRF